MPRPVPHERNMGPLPPPPLILLLWIRLCTSANKMEIIPHSLLAGVILPRALRSCRPQASKAPKSVGRPGTLPTNHPPLWRSHEFTMYCLTNVSPLGEFLPQCQWACIWPTHQHCRAFLDALCRSFNRVISMSPLGILSLRRCEECGYTAISVICASRT